jgi:hypothetical protein
VWHALGPPQRQLPELGRDRAQTVHSGSRQASLLAVPPVSRSGASDEAAGNAELRQRVRRTLTSGTLSLIIRKARVGRGSGRLCAVCTSSVNETDIEYEVLSTTGVVVAHLPCYLIWSQESEAWRIRTDDPADLPPGGPEG